MPRKRELKEDALTERVLTAAAVISVATREELDNIALLINERYKILEMKAAINLKSGTLVEFDLGRANRRYNLPKGSTITGTITSVDAKWCRVETLRYGTWKVAPSLLRPVTYDPARKP